MILPRLVGVRSQEREDTVVSALHLCCDVSLSLTDIGIRSASLHARSWDSPFSLQKSFRDSQSKF